VVKVENPKISLQAKERKIRVRNGIDESEVRQIEGRQLRSD
jgi:hypothetical protein